MKKSFFQGKLLKLSVRNLLIVFASLFAAMGIIELILNLTSITPETDNDNVVVMSYEKSPIESLLTTEENIVYAQRFFKDPKDLQKLLEQVTPSILKYPLIENLETTAVYNDDTMNIVVFGDSFVWGEASLNRNELFWRQMEQMLRAKGYNVRVYAIAEEGASAYEEIRWLESGVLDQLHPDLVLFGYVFNDALRPGNGFGKMPDILNIPQLPWLKLFPMVSQKIYAYIDAKTLYNKKFGDRYKNSWISVLDDEIYPYYKKNFVDKLDTFCKEHAIPAAVVTLPNDTNSLLLEELYKPLDTAFADTSIRYFNSYYEFKNSYSGRKHKKNIHVNANNVHPGSAAHYFYAEYICDFLLRDFSSLLGPPTNHDLNSKLLAINDRMPGDIDLQAVTIGETMSEYTFLYPDITQPHTIYDLEIEPYCLNAPIGTDYIKLSFENPVTLTEVSVTGDNRQKTELYYTTINKKLGYDDHTVTLWHCTDKNASLWQSNSLKNVTSLCIHSDSPGKLTVTIKGKAEG